MRKTIRQPSHIEMYFNILTFLQYFDPLAKKHFDYKPNPNEYGAPL